MSLKWPAVEISQPSYPGVLSCVRKSVCILWLQTDQVSVVLGRTKGQRTLIRLSSMNVAQGQSGTKHGAHDKCWLSGPSCRVMLQTVHTSPGPHSAASWQSPHTTWSRGCGHQLLCVDIMIQHAFVEFRLPSIHLSYNNMLTRLIIRVCFSSEHEGSLNHTTYNPYLQKTALTRDVKTLARHRTLSKL